MTPIHIEIMLHYSRGYPFPPNSPGGGPLLEVQKQLLDWGLIEHESDYPGHEHPLNFKVTDKGRAYVEQLCKVGPPTKQVWVYEP